VIINQRGSVYVGSVLRGNYKHRTKDEPSIFAREVHQLLQAGYYFQDNYLVPSPP